MIDIFPERTDGLCACGCEKELTGRKRRWHSKECSIQAYMKFATIKGDTSVIRALLLKRDGGDCAICGSNNEKWDADHILPVFKGGGGCGIDNLQTLCVKCHKAKTHFDMKKCP